MLVRQSKISLKRRQLLLECFTDDKTAKMAAKDSGVSREAATRYYRHYREHIFQYFRRIPRFEGEVEIDQAFFGHKGRRKIYGKGKLRIKKWDNRVMVLGVFCRGGDVYTHIIERADKKTLMPILHMLLEAGTIVYTDKWRAYNDLGIEQYEHRQVNHSQTFSDKQGNHINHIETFWSFAKRRLAKFNGIPKRTLPLHIKECEARFNTPRKDFLRFMKKIMK